MNYHVLIPWDWCKIMRVTFNQLVIALSITCMSYAHSGRSQQVLNQPVSVHFRHISIEDALHALEKQALVKFVYSKSIVNAEQKISMQMEQAPLKQVLDKLLIPAGIGYHVISDRVVLRLADEPRAHYGNNSFTPFGNLENIVISHSFKNLVKGRVSDEKGNPLPGVNIRIKGTDQGIITDARGEFSLEVSDENTVLVFSFVGYLTREITIGNRRLVEISLEVDEKALEEVVVVGYGTQKKINLTGAVAQISGEVLENRSVTNISQALQGQIANLNISSANGGGPGSAPSINIRGYTGLGSAAEPLIVIDGIQGGDLNSININDVESISVLKDAAAAAIYGSSAPYGVILITTKKGRPGQKPTITYNNNFGFAQPINLPKLMKSVDLANFFNEAADNSGSSRPIAEEQIQRMKDYLEGKISTETIENPTPGSDGWLGGNGDNDFFDLYLKNIVSNQQHNIGVSGTVNKTNYFLGLGYVKQNGVFRYLDDKFSRYNIRTNLSTNLTDWLTVSFRGAYSRSQKDDLNSAYSGWVGPSLHYIGLMWPWAVATYPNGTKNNLSVLFNEGGREIQTIDRATLTGEATFHLLPGWDLTANYTFDGRYGNTSQHLKTLYTDNAPSNQRMLWIGSPNSFTRSFDFSQHFTLNAFTSYEKQLGKHHFKALAGFTQELYNNMSVSGSNNFLYSDDLPALSLAYGTATSVSDAVTELAIRGGFGRINYSYKDKYLVEFNGRYDGTSKFLKDVRYKFYPGVSAAWILSREAFWEPLESTVNSLKIRASYGVLGDQGFTSNRYPFYPNLNVRSPTAANYLFGGGRESFIGNPPLINSSLTWVTVSTLDFGADLSFLSNRLTVSFDWYRRSMDDYVGPAEALPAFLGSSAPQTNSAAMKTEGIELTVGWRHKGTFSYGINAVLSDYSSVVTKYPNPRKIITSWYAGQKIGEIWGYETQGLFQSEAEIASAPSQSMLYNRWLPGDVRYVDLNGDNQIDWGNSTVENPGDTKVIGNVTPRFAFGVNTNAQYKDFDLALFFQGVGKRQEAPSPTSTTANFFWGVTGDIGQSSGYAPHYDRWSEDNRDGYFPRYYLTAAEMNKNKQTQTRYMLNAAYLRVKNVQLGYTLPSSMARRFGQKFRVFVNAENLLTVTRFIKTMDPEFLITPGKSIGVDGKVYPLQRVWAAGLQVTF